MYVCLCKGITDTQIKQAVADGAGSFRDVRDLLGTATQCGKCSMMTRDIVKRELHALEEQNPPLYYALG